MGSWSPSLPQDVLGASDMGLRGVHVPFPAAGHGLGTSDVGLSRVQAALQAAALAARCTGVPGGPRGAGVPTGGQGSLTNHLSAPRNSFPTEITTSFPSRRERPPALSSSTLINN